MVNNIIPSLDTLNIQITHICNLNCKGCAHFANILPSNIPLFYDITSFKTDIAIVSKHLQINKIVITGGETLLSPNLLEILTETRKCFPYSLIQLFTNGILLSKMSDLFFKTLKNLNIKILISFYKDTIQYQNINLNILSQYHIDYETAQNSQKGTVEIFYKKISLIPNSNMYASYRLCTIKDCIFLNNGRLYKCSSTANIYILGEKYNLPQFIQFSDLYGIDIHHITDWNKTINKLNSPETCCRYCNFKKAIAYKWCTDKPQLSDWIVE